MAKYILKEGFELAPFGEDSKIDANNITDAIAEYLIEVGRASLDDFEPIEEEKEVVIAIEEPVKEEKQAKEKQLKVNN
jgi:hypothetical protein